MEIAQLEKIVNDGLVRLKAFKEADIALNELKALEQAEKDLTAKVKALTSDKDNLEKDKANIMKYVIDTKKEADEALANAKAKADAVIAEAKAKGDSLVKAATVKASKAEFDIQEKLKKIADLDDATKLAQADFDKINAALADAKKRLKDIMG